MSDRHTVQPYPLRLQPDLRAKLEELAAASGRSLHAEIISRLESSIAGSETTANGDPYLVIKAKIAELSNMMTLLQNSEDGQKTKPKSSILFGQEAEPAKPLPKPTYPKPKR